MREIKFRIWHKKRMVYCDEGMVIEWVRGTLTYVNYAPYQIADEPPIMQYTGLKDKNGKEIYEGDILRETLSVDPETQEPHFFSDNLEVAWDDPNGTARWVYKQMLNGRHGSKYGFSSSMAKGNMHAFEVIGNIYENPELIK